MSTPILIVEDNPLNLKLAVAILTAAGREVATARSAEDALDVIRSVPPRLILLDIQLPGMDGFSLARRLRADTATRHIPIVGLSAYATKDDAEKAYAAGCDGYISKPIDPDRLVAQLDAYLNGESKSPDMP